MALNFPDPAGQTPANTFSPTSTPSATTNGVTYTWDGEKWVANSVSVGSTANLQQITDNGNTTSNDIITSGDIQATSFNGGQLSGMRNLVINGDMRISQRGNVADINTTTNNYGGPDRFALYSSSPSDSAVFSAIQESVTDVPGFKAAYRADCTTAASGALTGIEEIKILTIFEAANLQSLRCGYADAQQITLSFWVRSNQTGTGVIWFFRPDSVRHTSMTYTINAADTWEPKTLTVNADTTGIIPSDNGQGLDISWVLDSGPDYTSGTALNGTWEDVVDANRYVGQTLDIGQSTDDYFDITGVQLETGPVATPFEYRPYGTELNLCQRYYYGRDRVQYFYGTSLSNGGCTVAIYHPVKMRRAPDVTDTANYGPMEVTGDIKTYVFTRSKPVGGSQVDVSADFAYTADAEL